MSDEAFIGYPRPDRLLHYIKDYGEFHKANPKMLGGKVPKSQINIIADLVAYTLAKNVSDAYINGGLYKDELKTILCADTANARAFGLRTIIEKDVSLSMPMYLDYGSGKGYQYLRHRIHERWGGIMPYCYDPGVIQLSQRPQTKFDGIICLDVLEHIEEEDINDVLADIFGYLQEDRTTFAFLHICCRPARKVFPDGRNLHRTIKPPQWWDDRIGHYQAARPKCYLKKTYELQEQES